VLLHGKVIAGKTVFECVQGRTLFACGCPGTLTTGASLCFCISGIRPGRFLACGRAEGILLIDDVSELFSHGYFVADVLGAGGQALG
jgi:hypothetical protein